MVGKADFQLEYEEIRKKKAESYRLSCQTYLKLGGVFHNRIVR